VRGRQYIIPLVLVVVSFFLTGYGLSLLKEKKVQTQAIPVFQPQEKKVEVDDDTFRVIIKGLVVGSGLPLRILGSENSTGSVGSSVGGFDSGFVEERRSVRPVIEKSNKSISIVVEEGKEREVLVRYKEVFDLIFSLSKVPFLKVNSFCVGEDCKGVRINVEKR